MIDPGEALWVPMADKIWPIMLSAQLGSGKGQPDAAEGLMRELIINGDADSPAVVYDTALSRT